MQDFYDWNQVSGHRYSWLNWLFIRSLKREQIADTHLLLIYSLLFHSSVYWHGVDFPGVLHHWASSSEYEGLSVSPLSGAETQFQDATRIVEVVISALMCRSSQLKSCFTYLPISKESISHNFLYIDRFYRKNSKELSCTNRYCDHDD